MSRMSSITNPLRTIEQTAPLFPVAIGLVFGIVADHHFRPSVIVYVLLFLLAGVLMIPRVLRERWNVVAVFFASVCVGGVLHDNQTRRIPPSSIELYLQDSPVIARIRGTVVSPPSVLKSPPHTFSRWTFGQDRTTFLLDAESIEGVSGDVPITGRIRVKVSEAVLDLHENQRVELFGKLYRFSPPKSPGSYDWRAHYRRKCVLAC